MNFTQWLNTEEGKKCASWPVTDQAYLQNRLWWAFGAGYEAARVDAMRSNTPQHRTKP